MSIYNWVEKEEQLYQVKFNKAKRKCFDNSFYYTEKVILPPHDEGVQVACGQCFSVCLTISGKILIWGSISGKITNDDGLFFNKPEYV
jgi:alpha-tubulin suppressor-like RCC1 family protein